VHFEALCEAPGQPLREGIGGLQGALDFFENSLLTRFVERTYKPLPDETGPAEKQGGASKNREMELRRRGFCTSFRAREITPAPPAESLSLRSIAAKKKETRNLRV
jgi:hypothetical protein